MDRPRARIDSPVKILVVDDLPAQRVALTAALAELGEDVVTVGSGADALRLLLDHEVAVILLDVNMPGMDGFETATLIREHPRTRHTPIIFLTADTDEMLLPRAYALGAVDFILNPFVPDILRAKVRVFVELSRLQASVRREAEQRIALSQAQAARAAAEEESRRLGFLAEVGAILSYSLDAPTTVRELLDLFVPRLADVAALALTDGQLVWRMGDEPAGKNDVALEARQRAIEAGLQRAVAEGKPVAIEPPPGLTGVVLPLVARGRTVGAVAAARLGTATYAEADRELLRLVAARTALALDNSRLYHEIQARDRQKDEFLAMLSHELRNPLGAITMAAHLLQSVGLDGSAAAQARDVLLRQSEHLARIVDDLLDVAQVTTGHVTLHRAPIHLGELVEQALDALRVGGHLQHHQVMVDLQPAVVDVDAVRTTQIITNILVNALKYTDPGGRIHVALYVEGPYAVLRVQDTGIGMNADMLQRLFQPFSQESQALDRARGGLGLGLTLVRRLVELQGGHVEAHSEGPGRGSTFTVRVPCATPVAAPAAPGAVVSASMRILIVEDNRDAREMLRTILELSGHEVYEAADGVEGLRLARELAPQVALIDLGLPGLDGLEVAARIRSTAGGADILLVALTGYGQAHDRQRTQEIGFDLHVVKPVAGPTVQQILAWAASRLATGSLPR